jgi:hypothetical protein
LLKMRKTSLTVEPPGSVRMASPAIASKGNWREMFSGMRHVVQGSVSFPLTTPYHGCPTTDWYRRGGRKLPAALGFDPAPCSRRQGLIRFTNSPGAVSPAHKVSHQEWELRCWD